MNNVGGRWLAATFLSGRLCEKKHNVDLPLGETMVTAAPIETPPVEPMTWSLLGRFFGVPLLIISVIVGGAVVVVLLFGGPSAPEKRSLESLLTALESNSGERSAGVLLPREKELWQTALELSERLEKKESELTPDELHKVAARLAAMVEVELAHIDKITATSEDAGAQRNLRSSRFDFLMRALARTETEEALAPLIAVVNSRREPYVALAVQQLANLHELSAATTAVDPILKTLTGSPSTETLLTSATALSVLAPKGDARTIQALRELLPTHDGEVGWSLALALARLGDSAGKSTLMDLLDRRFLESGPWFRVVDSSGNVRSHPLPPERVKALLIAAMDAAATLDDADLWSMIDRLKSDTSPEVKGRAMAVSDRRARPKTPGENG